LDVAYQWIVPNEEIEDDATIEGEVRQVEEEGKSTKVVEKVKQIFADVNIVDIFDEDETISLSHLYS
jgi:AmiR/NasT family two-component response regulator